MPHPRQAPLAADSYLEPFLGCIRERRARADATARRLAGDEGTLADFAAAHTYFGLHRDAGGWTFREWAPNAEAISLVGDFSDWQESSDYALQPMGDGNWELRLPPEALAHGAHYKLSLHWPGGGGQRLPAYARRVVQDHNSKIFSAQVWSPPGTYSWQHPDYRRPDQAPLIYEAHVGMAQEHGGVGTYDEFRLHVLPRIAAAGYNTVQLMAIQEHPYYGSFGYHVSNFFAASSRYGTPEELKALVDAAHGLGLAVIMDLVHSHAVRNELEGLAALDGTRHQYFHAGGRGEHRAWDSLCFDYGKIEVLHFLLSNCRFWLDEYHFDGYRFDGITSMLYLHHGLGGALGGYGDYFNDSVDEDAVTYLSLANDVIHALRPDAITVAEDVSGMPGLVAPASDNGVGFDYRLGMGVPDHWFRLLKEVADEDWHMGQSWHELTNHRAEEKIITYVECHDQSIVGGKTMIFELIDAAMYGAMHVDHQDARVDRGMALHKMIRLATLLSAGHGYLNFMGNEFGHPEWVDFPREGNNWSHHYARRQWHLRDDPDLKYHFLADFDQAMIRLVNDSGALETREPRLLWLHEADNLLVFERAGLFLFFNFHPTQSHVDYPVEILPGDYHLVLDTDDGRFGGHGRIEPGQVYPTSARTENSVKRDYVHLYLPARTAVVLKREQLEGPR